MNRKICVVTGTRADYGLLRWVMEEIRGEVSLDLQLVATGMHLSPEFGLTFREIEDDGFTITSKIETLLGSDTPVAITKSMGLGLIGFGETLSRLEPDLLLVLGDRYEIYAAVAAAMILGIPVAHLHGGETTQGAFDEGIRHCISKMSQLHFVATAEYRKRVIQLGETPDRVFLVGGLGVDSIERLSLLDRDALEKSLGFEFGRRNLLVTYHPETLGGNKPGQQLNELLSALDTLTDTQLIFTMPNADTDSRVLIDMIGDYVRNHENATVFTSLGQLRYLSCIKYVDGVVGNSSSGLAEVPSFRKGTVNIGDRQKGRLRAKSVIDCDGDRESIVSALNRLFSAEFQSNLDTVVNPYGEGGASKKIVNVLKDYPLQSILKKKFYDLDFDPDQQSNAEID